MANKTSLTPAFKKKAEETSVNYRKELGLFPWSPLDAFKLAAHLNIPIYTAGDILKDVDEFRFLTENCGWSALTMQTQAKNKIIIHNHLHPPARQQANIMHEIAHILCGHQHTLSHTQPLPMGMREFNKEQEDEAICLGAAMQIARPGLLWALKREMPIESIAVHFNASKEMVNYRLHATGANKQAHYARLKRNTI